MQYNASARSDFPLLTAPIMNTLLGKQLRYLSDENLAWNIIAGTHKTPTDLIPATKLILKNIGKLGIKLINGEGSKIIITTKKF
jgi:hypothetical protein